MAAKTARQVDSLGGMNTNQFDTWPRCPEVAMEQFWVAIAQWVQSIAPNFAKIKKISKKNLQPRGAPSAVPIEVCNEKQPKSWGVYLNTISYLG